MRERAKIAQYLTGGDTVLHCPEAHGVNVYATLSYSIARLQKIKYLTLCRHIALIGFKQKEEK